MSSKSYGSDLHGGVRAAAQRSHCGDTSNPRKFCLPAVSSEEGWGPETSNKLEVPQSICENRAFQNGGAPSAPRPSTVSGLDDEDGPEEYLSTGPHSLRPSTPPFISMRGQDRGWIIPGPDQRSILPESYLHTLSLSTC